MEAYQKKNYLKYIKEESRFNKGDNIIQYYIRFYVLYCRIPKILLTIGKNLFTSTFLFKNEPNLLEVAEFGGKRVEILCSKKLPQPLIVALPPLEFKDADKEKKRKGTPPRRGGGNTKKKKKENILWCEAPVF